MSDRSNQLKHLSDALTERFCEQLHGFDLYDAGAKLDFNTLVAEQSVARTRYFNDPVFNARIRALVNSTMDLVVSACDLQT